MASTAPKGAADVALDLVRVLDAPRERVFAAWTDPARVAKWMGPGGWVCTPSRLEARPGGAYALEMRHTDGDRVTAVGTYREVVPPERLVFTWAWLGEDGKPGHQSLVTVTFRAVGQKTELTLRHEGFDTAESRDNHRDGWSSCLDKLADYL